MKIVFISSLERSGSTILDLKLSSHPKMISFGEVWRVIKPHGAGLDSVRGRLCTCGELGRDCSVWSHVFDRIEDSGADTLHQCYVVFLDVVKEIYGNDIVVVDSSKSIKSLDALAHIKNAELNVLFTARDVRGWMESIHKAKKRKKEIPWSRVFQPGFKYFLVSYIRHNILRLFPFWLPNEWMLRNLRILHNINKSRLPCLLLSYEELVFRPKNTVERIENFLELPQDQHLTVKEPNVPHIIRGNRTAFKSDQKAPLRYDGKWMSLWKSSAILSVLPWIAHYNKKWVYNYQYRESDGD